MDERTLIALQGSIRKWADIAMGHLADNGVENCPLCLEFYANRCKGCPVREKTGLYGCEDTPYDEWASHDEGSGSDGFALTPEAVRLAEAERDFLKSLLPSSPPEGLKT